MFVVLKIDYRFIIGRTNNKLVKNINMITEKIETNLVQFFIKS